MSNYDFYLDRLNACPIYGFKAGSQILELVLSCAQNDSSLTEDEYNSIIKWAESCHIALMEDNYNGDWK